MLIFCLNFSALNLPCGSHLKIMNEVLAWDDSQSLRHLIYQEKFIFRDKTSNFQRFISSAYNFWVSPIIHGWQITKTYKTYLYAQIYTVAPQAFSLDYLALFSQKLSKYKNLNNSIKKRYQISVLVRANISKPQVYSYYNRKQNIRFISRQQYKAIPLQLSFWLRRLMVTNPVMVSYPQRQYIKYNHSKFVCDF